MQLTWDVGPTFELFGLTIRYYSVFFGSLFVLGYIPLRWQLVRGGGKSADCDYIVLAALAGVILGGRIGHVLFYETATFLANPAMMFDLSRGGLASHGSVTGLIIGVVAIAKIRGYRILDLCDRVSFGSMLAPVCVRLGNFFNSEIVGRPTDQTWGIRFPHYDQVVPAPLRHPSQLYEVALGLVALAVLLAVDRRLGEDRPVGLMSATVFAVYFGGRFVLEFFKEYQALEPGAWLRMGQWLSLPPALLGIAGIYIVTRRTRNPAPN